MGIRANGEIVRLDAKIFKPYLLTHPDHIQHVLRTNPQNYLRDSVFFRPLFRMFPQGILGESEENWDFSRRSIQPMFTARHVQVMMERLIELVNEGLDDAEEPARTGTPMAVRHLMGSVVNKAIVGLIFGDRIPRQKTDDLAVAADTIVKTMVPRMVTPFFPGWFPRPGDRGFRKAVALFDETMKPLARERDVVEGQADMLSLLIGTPQPDGSEPTDSWLRDNYVGMYTAATETTAIALTWLWPAVAAHPEVLARLKAEVWEVVGDGPVAVEHIRKLVYTRQVIDETLRWRPVVWLVTRGAEQDDVIGGVRIPKGADVIISQWVTHRSPLFWDRPDEFDPDRFAPDAPARNRYAYFPFGGGGHQCIGKELFLAEAVIVVASMLSRFDLVKIVPEDNFTPQLAATLRPKDEAYMTLKPRR
ncbi:hypothetical protein GCM10010468_07220 [Actinocorallia longicatena]|uniref:Cytochrome P450 n=2 Tax=Actinocorallia longicatena TaxID=111803 RepID=A0ABP6PZC2_9ACTN